MLYSISFLVLFASSCSAFTQPFLKSNNNHGFQIQIVDNGREYRTRHQHPTPLSTLQMAGFGGGGSTKKGGKKKKNKSPLVLKPKQQWDRYANLKASAAFKVAVRVVNGDDNNEWLEAGKVKSKNDESTEIAVALQRGIIAEV